MNWILAVLCLLITQGCAWFQGRALPPPAPPLTVLVGPVTLDAPVTSPSDLYTFQQRPSSEVALQLLGQLIEEVEVTGQRLFTEQLGRQPGFVVVPFAEARRLQTNQSLRGHPLDTAAMRALGEEAHADVVITGRIVDYGVVRWQYWVPGLLLSMMTETLIVGAATGFNPGLMAAAAGSELLTDVPFWWGGAYVAGWAFRPVRVKAEALEVQGCVEKPWTEEALVMLVPGRTLREFPPDERRRKEVQLTVNLSRAVTKIADGAGRELRLARCAEPEPASHESVTS
ncbi:MAG: hypothetical protein UZ03_NOB001002737 [Nitrospira sp. OLB3]|nr:MAG: hypothetical protein UZ03_NOB001002737 [Nitrospira sp. OLB3]